MFKKREFLYSGITDAGFCFNLDVHTNNKVSDNERILSHIQKSLSIFYRDMVKFKRVFGERVSRIDLSLDCWEDEENKISFQSLLFNVKSLSIAYK